MATITFDARKLTGPLNELVKVQIPETSRLALNEALFATQKRLKDEANKIVDSPGPTPFTLNSFKYDKGKIEDKRVVGRAYVRDDAPGGNAPSRYLNPQIRGGPAYQTRFSRRLMHHTAVTQIDGRRTTAQQPGTMLSPSASKKVRRNRYGNMSQGQYTQILTALSGGASSADLLVNGDVMASQRDQSYTYLDELALDHPYFKNRLSSYGQKPGIYKIERTANPNPRGPRRLTRFYRVMTERSIKTYRPKFRFFEISEETVAKEFVQRFQRRILR